MRPIKFKAKETNLDEVTVYGIGFISSTCAYDFLVTEDGKYVAVKRNSVKQLIGYDKNGNEVYDGDTLIDDFGKKCTVKIGFNISYDKILRPIGEQIKIVEIIKNKNQIVID